MSTQELFGTGGITTVALVKRPERRSDESVAWAGWAGASVISRPAGLWLGTSRGGRGTAALADSMTPGLAVALVRHG
jgi:predicted MFS family arabinose efflux permease